MPYVQGKYLDRKWPSMMTFYTGYMNELWHVAMQMGHVIASKRSDGGSGISALKAEIHEGLVGSNMPLNHHFQDKKRSLEDIISTIELQKNLVQCLPLTNNCEKCATSFFLENRLLSAKMLPGTD